MGSPIRVLQVFASLDRGGAETMIMNLYRTIDKSTIQFDFVVNENKYEYAYENEIRNLGGNVFKLPRYNMINYLRYKHVWNKLLRDHPEWKIIHGHNTTPASIYLKEAKKQKRYTIAHSHTAGGDKTLKSNVKIMLRKSAIRYSDSLFSCSNSAYKWMFGKDNNKAILIKNSIEPNYFRFNKKIRNKVKESLGIKDNEFIIGHIGNFSSAKNYPFILEIFNEVIKSNGNAKLMLVGKNESNPEVQRNVIQMGLEKNVIFTGVRSDIPDLMQAMDVFLFPSVNEGLPVTLIEAQASGLKIIASDIITREVAITQNIEFLPLNKSAKYWAAKLLSYQISYEREDNSEEIRNAGYDVKENVLWLENFYVEKSKTISNNQ